MSDLTNNLTLQANGTKGLAPILRNIEIAEFTVAGVNLGNTALKSQVSLDVFVEEIVMPDEQAPDSKYLGEIEINHIIKLDTLQSTDEPEVASAPVDSDETTEHRYIDTEHVEPTGNDPYPNKSPLLASN
jgi:hypothetical protein